MSALLQRIGGTFDYISRVRIAILAACAACVFFVLPDQALELYVIYSQAVTSTLPTGATVQSVFEAVDFPLVLQFVFGIVATVLLCTVIWLCTLRLLLASQETPPERAVPPAHHELAATTISRLPAVALMIGFNSAKFDAAVRGLPEATLEQRWLATASAILGVLILLNALV
jgi:hypothetical protein